MKRKNIHWFTLIELIVAMTLFATFMTIRFVNDNKTYERYLHTHNESKKTEMLNDVYGYLYAFKNTYWTYMFQNEITRWDADRNCNGNDFNWNWLLDESIDEYCFFYPYVSDWKIRFYNWNLVSNSSELNQAVLSDNNKDGNDGESYRKLFWQQDSIITIALKQDFTSPEIYRGFIWIYDTNMLAYTHKLAITLD